MSYRENDTEVAYVRRRVIKTDLIDGVRRSHMPEYKIWTGILARCNNPALKAYPRYGGRGIRVCQRWEEDFRNFYDDLGPRPSDRHSIDRIDNDGDYEPQNCRWATPDVQAKNKGNPSRDNGFYWSEDDIQTLKQMWAKHYSEAEISAVLGRSPATVRLRASNLKLKRDGSLTRLIRRHSDLAHILREKGREAFIGAVADKGKWIADKERVFSQKEIAAQAERIAVIMSSDCCRNTKMKDLRAQGLNLSQIGEQFGITRERVRQIEAKGWPEEWSTENSSGLSRKVSSTNPKVRAKKIERLCRAWNSASREARLMFLQASPDFLASKITLDDVEAAVEARKVSA